MTFQRKVWRDGSMIVAAPPQSRADEGACAPLAKA
jgi:hypothetical protein